MNAEYEKKKLRPNHAFSSFKDSKSGSESPRSTFVKVMDMCAENPGSISECQ